MTVIFAACVVNRVVNRVVNLDCLRQSSKSVPGCGLIRSKGCIRRWGQNRTARRRAAVTRGWRTYSASPRAEKNDRPFRARGPCTAADRAVGAMFRRKCAEGAYFDSARACAEGAALATAEHAEIFAPFGECTGSKVPLTLALHSAPKCAKLYPAPIFD